MLTTLRRCLLLAGFTAGLAGVSAAADSPDSPPPTEPPPSARFRAVLDELNAYADETARQLGGAPFALVISHHGRLVYERYESGVDGAAPLGVVTPAARWPLFSMTKSYAAALLLMLEHDNVLTLGDPLHYHVPELVGPGAGAFDRRAMTLDQLASHTSGATYAAADWNAFPPPLEKVYAATAPGEVFAYTAQGMFTLQQVIERITGRDYVELLRERVLQPLELTETDFYHAVDPEIPMLPVRQREPGEPAESTYAFTRAGLNTGAGLYATARDANKFARVWLKQGTLDGTTHWKPDRQAEVWRHHSTRPSDGGHYGLLWWLFEDEPGYVMSGAGAKLTALSPSTGVAVTLLRLPLDESDPAYSFFDDKLALVRFANRLGAPLVDRVAMAARILELLEEGETYRKFLHDILLNWTQKNGIPWEVMLKMREEVHLEPYLAEAAEMLAHPLTDEELQATVEYYEQPANRDLSRALQAAHQQLAGEELEARRRWLAQRHPWAWRNTEAYFQGTAAPKIDAVRAQFNDLARRHADRTLDRALLLVRTDYLTVEPPGR